MFERNKTAAAVAAAAENTRLSSELGLQKLSNFGLVALLRKACRTAGCPDDFEVFKLPEFLVAVTARMHELELQNAAQAALLQSKLFNLDLSESSVVVCPMPADQLEAGHAIYAHLRSVLPAHVKCLVHADNISIYDLDADDMRRAGWVAAVGGVK